MRNYAVETSPEADQDLSAFPLPLQRLVVRELYCLAADPTALSQPAQLLQSRGRRFYTHFPFADLVCHLEVIFQYAQSESLLYILAIGCEFVPQR